ncbi:MAG: beta-ketoacyl-ACP synthase II [Candidatus Dormibacteria bacterium]
MPTEPPPPPAGTMGRHRVVITGLGTISPLGNDRDSTWSSICHGRSGIAAIERFDVGDLPSRIAGEVHGFDAAAELGSREARRAGRVVHLALAAAREAVADGCLDVTADADDIGVVIGTSAGALDIYEAGLRSHGAGGYRTVGPFAATGTASGMPAAMVAMDVGARGPNFAMVSACASGAHAVGEAAEQIRRGDAVAMIAGGSEAALPPARLAALCAIRALSRRNDDPQRASRPFDRDRDGFVPAEGAAILLLEEREHALARGAHIHAELAGYAATADAWHATRPIPDGSGARRCIERALARAGRSAGEVGYVNAHGTGTRLNDLAETRALQAVLGADADRVPVSSTKSMTGHLMGAAGALEAVLTVLALEEGFLPPTINLDAPDPECHLDHIAHRGRRVQTSLALSTSFGFGGQNACLVFSQGLRQRPDSVRKGKSAMNP